MADELKTEVQNKIKLEDVRYLVFEGGSVKGIAYVGAWEEAISNGLKFNQLKGVAGTSAGAISAMLVALGFSVEEMYTQMSKLDFKAFLDGDDVSVRDALFAIKDQKTKPGMFSQSTKHSTPLTVGSTLLKESFGLFDGEVCRKWLEARIREKAKNEKGETINFLTFRELHDLVKKNPGKYCDLYVVGNCVNTNISQVFSWETTPDVIISDAIRISMSIPIIFKPHQVYVKKDGERKIDSEQENLLFIDGGVTDNLPFFIFDKRNCWPDELKDNLPSFPGGLYTNPTTLGFHLVNKKEADRLLNDAGELPVRKNPATKNIDGFLNYLSVVVKSFYEKQKSDLIHAQVQWRTVCIDTCGINMLDFDLTEEQKQKLIASGHAAIEEFIGAEPVIEHPHIQSALTP